jgi:hypothetical protein
MNTYRVHYRITGWVEVEATSDDDALDQACEKDAAALVADTIGPRSVDLDEVESNP